MFLNSLFRTSLLLFFFFALLSCEKKYIEIIPVAELEKDISVPGAGPIKFLEFYPDLTGFAADTSTIYKTINGGESWQAVSVPSGFGGLRNVVFFDNTHGLCLRDQKVFNTIDGGLTWMYKAEADFIGISANGKGVYGREESVIVYDPDGYSSYRTIVCRVKISSDKGLTFPQTNDINTNYDTVIGGFVTGTKVYAIMRHSQVDVFIKGLDLETGQTGRDQDLYLDNLRGYAPLDVFDEGGNAAIATTWVRLEGNAGYGLYQRANRVFYSVSVKGSSAIAVGKNSLITNINNGTDDFWKEMFDENGKTFMRTFYKVRQIDENNFYVGGDNGLIWKMRI